MSPNTIQNNVVGVGVILGWQENRGSSTTGRVIVDAMAHGWPAELCGKMAVGDTILAVDSKEVADSTALFERIPDKLSAVREMIVGKQDSLVTFKLLQANGKIRDVRMIRLAAASSPPPSISQSNHAGIGVVLDGECCVASISKGGAARINGGIHVGDTVWSVDGAEFPSGTDPEVVMLALEGPLGSRARVGLVSKAKGGILNVDVVRMPDLADHLVIRATLHKQRLAAALEKPEITTSTVSANPRSPLSERTNILVAPIQSPNKPSSVSGLHKQWRPSSSLLKEVKDQNNPVVGKPPAHPSSSSVPIKQKQSLSPTHRAGAAAVKGLHTALYSYRPARDDELSLKRGDTILIVGPAPDPGWMIAQRDGNTGLIPANYIGKPKDPPGQIPTWATCAAPQASTKTPSDDTQSMGDKNPGEGKEDSVQEDVASLERVRRELEQEQRELHRMKEAATQQPGQQVADGARRERVREEHAKAMKEVQRVAAEGREAEFELMASDARHRGNQEKEHHRREVTLEEEMSLLGRKQNEERREGMSGRHDKDDSIDSSHSQHSKKQNSYMPLLPSLSPLSHDATGLRRGQSVSPGTSVNASSGESSSASPPPGDYVASPPPGESSSASPPPGDYVGVWSDWGDSAATPPSKSRVPDVTRPQLISDLAKQNSPPAERPSLAPKAPEAAQFFQGPRLSAYFDEMPSSPASPTLQFLPVPSADPPSDVLHTISPKATFSHAEAASINVPSQPASTSTASPPPPAFQAPSRPSITLPIPPPSPAFHAPHAHAISPPRANLSSSHSLEQESPLPPAPLFLAAHAPSSRAEAPLPTQPSFNEAQKPPSPNFNAPLRPSFTSPAHAPTEPDTVKATAVRLGATEVQIKACESEAELQALIDILSGSFDMRVSPAHCLLSAPSVLSQSASVHASIAAGEGAHVLIARARNLPSTGRGFFCIVSCTGGRGGGRTGVFPGADVALDQDVVVRGGGDVVVWLYREEGGADSVVGEVRMGAGSLSSARGGQAEGWYDLQKSGQVVRTSEGVAALFIRFSSLSCQTSSTSSTSPPRAHEPSNPPLHWGGALSVPSHESSNRHHPRFAAVHAHCARAHEAWSAQQQQTSQHRASSARPHQHHHQQRSLALPGPSSGAIRPSGAREEFSEEDEESVRRRCEELEGRERLLRTEVMTLREQLSQAMTAREASASDLLTVTERCRMLENTLATFASQSGPGSAGSLAELQMENELLAKEVHTLRFGYVPGKPRFAARGVVEGKTTWLDKWAAMLDDASRKITGAGPVASTLLRLRTEVSAAQQHLAPCHHYHHPEVSAAQQQLPQRTSSVGTEGGDTSTRLF